MDEPLILAHPETVLDLVQALRELLTRRQRGTLATVARRSGSTPRARARLLLSDDGSTFGTVGGGRMEIFVEPILPTPRFAHWRALSDVRLERALKRQGT